MNKRMRMTGFAWLAAAALLLMGLTACSEPSGTEPTASPALGTDAPAESQAGSRPEAGAMEDASVWTSLDAITDEELLRYPMGREVQQSNLNAIEGGASLEVEAMSGIHYLLGVEASAERTASVAVEAEGVTNLELVLIKADATVEHIQAERGTREITFPAGYSSFAVLGVQGTGRVSVAVDDSELSLDPLLDAELMKDLIEK